MSSAIRSVIGGASSDLEDLAEGDLKFSESDVDYYAVRVYRDGEQGAGKVDGFEELERPIRKEAFEEAAQVDGLERGTYKLLALGGEHRRILGAVWSMEAGVRSPKEQADVETRVARLEHRENERSSANIEGPGDVLALIMEQVLEEDELSVDYEIGRLSDFLSEWLRRENPPGPEYYAGLIIERLFAEGENEAALQMLDIWMASNNQGESEQSLIEVAKEIDDLDLTLGDATALGFLKLIDNPEEIGRAAGQAMNLAQQLESREADGPVTDSKDSSEEARPDGKKIPPELQVD